MGTINASGAISSGNNVTANASFVGSATTAVLASAGAGTVYLRPNGYNSAAGQFTVDSAGTATATGAIYATTIFVVKATSGNVHYQWVGSDGGQRAIFYTPSVGQGIMNMTVGGYNWYMNPANGAFLSPGVVYTGNGAAFVNTDGNVYGSVWTNLGYGDAYTAIVNRIESRAIAWANDRVANMQFRRVSQGYSGNIVTFTCPAGCVLSGYSREGGNSGQLYGCYFVYLQSYDPVRGWVTFVG